MSLISTDEGFELHLASPSVSSLPVGSLQNLFLTVDGQRIPDVAIDLAGHRVDAASLASEEVWWLREEQLVLAASSPLVSGRHDIEVDFELVIPYLHYLRDTPVALPIHFSESFEFDASMPGRSIADGVGGMESPA